MLFLTSPSLYFPCIQLLPAMQNAHKNNPKRTAVTELDLFRLYHVPQSEKRLSPIYSRQRKVGRQILFSFPVAIAQLGLEQF